MKYLFINSVFGVGSTGRIIKDECSRLRQEGHTCAAAYGRECADDGETRLIPIGNKADVRFHAVMTRLFDMHGYCSYVATRRFLKDIEEFDPDVIWLHNLHGYYLNIGILFGWLKAHPNVKVLWTLHDCWSFTGHCAHFTAARCDRWRMGCCHCPQLKTYPMTLGLDFSKRNYADKRRIFTGVNDMQLIVPSEWLATLVKQSFLKAYPVKVVPNKVDSKIFRPTTSNFRERFGLRDKYVVLGVAGVWDEYKGLQDFLKLAESLDSVFTVVLVGVTAKQAKSMPKGVITIQHTDSAAALAEIYSAADVFVNPTHQDNYPTVNLEARACGTPVVTYNVGGSPESAGGRYIVEENDIGGLVRQIYAITGYQPVEI